MVVLLEKKTVLLALDVWWYLHFDVTVDCRFMWCRTVSSLSVENCKQLLFIIDSHLKWISKYRLSGRFSNRVIYCRKLRHYYLTGYSLFYSSIKEVVFNGVPYSSFRTRVYNRRNLDWAFDSKYLSVD